MTLVRRERETQLSFVGRMLTEHGEVRAWDLYWDSRYADGRKTAVTRAAAVIHTLRHSFGWDIETVEDGGQVATYRLAGRPDTPRPRPAPATVPPWAQGWACLSCGGAPDSAPDELLGGLATALCSRCGGSRHFRRRQP